MRLRSTLVIVSVSLLLATVLLVAGSAYITAKRSADELTRDVLAQATDRMERTMLRQLATAVSANELTSRLFARGTLRADDPEGFATYASDVMVANPWLSYVSFGREDTGELAQAERHGTAVTVRFVLRHGDSVEITDFAVAPDGSRTPLRTLPGTVANLPTSRPYYLAARDAKHTVWTETYAFFGEGGKLDAPGVTLATPIYAADGHLLGVLTADFDFHATSQALANLDLFAHGSAFVVEYRKDGGRRVIAHPRPELLGRRVGDSVEGVTVADIDDPLVRAFAKALPPDWSHPVADMTPVSFDAGGARYVGGFRMMTGGDEHWIVCAFTPEEDVLGQVHANNRRALLIILAGTLGAIALALWLGSRIAAPLRAVAEETESIGRFHLDLRKPPRTGVLEVRRLGEAVEEMKRNLRSFRKYVPAEVVRELVTKGEEAALGGKYATLTIHFSDIAGFTSIAEQSTPEALVAMLGEYLDEMTKPILASGGTVDKFIGDAVMAFWGAPRPTPDHALHACETALANRDRLAALNEQWTKAGRPRIEARVGLHTGEVIVGNIGSSERLDYTVIGDAVNLASRLEGLNKRYGTSILISGATFELVKDKLVARHIDRVAVKGKKQGVDVYELLGKRGEVPADVVARAARYDEAFALYLDRKFVEAKAIFAELDTGDRAVKDLLRRCDAFIAKPPPEGWSGAEEMRSK